MSEQRTSDERVAAANERVRQAAKRLAQANAELDAAEREQRIAWEQLIKEDPNAAC